MVLFTHATLLHDPYSTCAVTTCECLHATKNVGKFNSPKLIPRML